MAGNFYLNDAAPGVTTVEMCQTQTLHAHFDHEHPDIIEQYILDYGDENIDTLEDLSVVDYKYALADTYQVDLTLVTGNGGCILEYRNHTIVNDANGLKIGTIIGDTLNCVGDTNGVITLYSEFGGTPPYMYAFSTNPFGYNRVYDNLGPGYYKISIRDSIGCIADTNIRVKSPDPIVHTYCFRFFP